MSLNGAEVKTVDLSPLTNTFSYMTKFKDDDIFRFAEEQRVLHIAGSGIHIAIHPLNERFAARFLLRSFGKIVTPDILVRLMPSTGRNTESVISRVSEMLNAQPDLSAPVTRYGYVDPYSLSINRPVEQLRIRRTLTVTRRRSSYRRRSRTGKMLNSLANNDVLSPALQDPNSIFYIPDEGIIDKVSLILQARRLGITHYKDLDELRNLVELKISI